MLRPCQLTFGMVPLDDAHHQQLDKSISMSRPTIQVFAVVVGELFVQLCRLIEVAKDSDLVFGQTVLMDDVVDQLSLRTTITGQ